MREWLEEARRSAYKILAGGRTPIIIMHWDADGIISASILISWLRNHPHLTEFIVTTPPFTYSWGMEFIEQLRISSRNASYMGILDLGVPGPLIDMTARMLGLRTLVIDHHRQEEKPKSPRVTYINPAAEGDPKGLWPSTAHIVSTILGWGDPLFVAASIVGDLGRRARDNPVFAEYMKRAGLDPENDYWVAEECARLLDAPSEMGRRDLVERLPLRLSVEEDPCKAVLSDGLLASMKVQAETEFEDILANAEPERRGDIMLYRLRGQGRHASRLSRILASKHKDKVVVVYYEAESTGERRIYARTFKSGAPPLVSAAEALRRKGYSAGGKAQEANNVLAVELRPVHDADEAIEDVMGELDRILGKSKEPGANNK